MNALPSNLVEKDALFYSLLISLLISHSVFGGLFVCFSAILFSSHSICRPSIVVIEHYWMETWIEGRIKGREERKEPRKWVKEQRGKRCQYVISPRDWTKREGRVPFSLTLTLGLCLHVQARVLACVWVGSPTQCALALCHSAALTFMYLWHAPVFPSDRNFNNQPLSPELCVCVFVRVFMRVCVWMCGCMHVCRRRMHLARRCVFITLYSPF